MRFSLRPFAVLAALLALIALYFRFSPQGEKAGPRVTLAGHDIYVEIADTTEKQTQGLSGHAPLANDEGMLFLFPETRMQSFWMKDMLFPIDIVWIRGERIVGWAADVQPEPGKPLDELTLYRSPEPVDKVLEVNAGLAQALGLAVGDEVMIK